MAIGNLLDNALAFSSTGGRIDISVDADARHARITVRDHGPGVPDYALARLGERFYSTARPAEPGQAPRRGSGLGLAIVRQIMQLHGGQLQLDQASPGLQATLSLPLAPAPR
jgi:two-component system sensor histidine kinase CreC